ncbi:MAG: AMP-binding protein, partial [Synechococcales cyanobacterium]
DQPLKKQKLVFGLLGLSQRYVQARRVIQGMSLQCLKPTIFQRITALGQFLLLAPINALADRIAYGKIREATGGRLKQVISGGGSLALHYDTFFEIIGINILVGYGLTETSPVLTVRRIWRNLRGSAGQPIPGTEIRVVDLETRQTLPIGQQGLVLARGPQIMQGY